MTLIQKRTLAGVFLGFVLSFVVSILAQRSLGVSLYGAAVMAIITGIVVGVLSWAIEYAESKGYPGWLGFVLVLFLNIFGIIILFLLPRRKTARNL